MEPVYPLTDRHDAGCLSCCCPCCQIGKNAEAIGLGGFCACCCAAYCFAICTGTYVRFKVRILYFFSPMVLTVSTGAREVQHHQAYLPDLLRWRYQLLR